MNHRHIISVPQISVNDDSVLIISLLKQSGMKVSKGESLIEAETTKNVFEINAETDGFFFPIVIAGDRTPVGRPVAVVSNDERDSLEAIQAWLAERKQPQIPGITTSAVPYTKKALVVAGRLGIDISKVTTEGDKITEKDVLRFYEQVSPRHTASHNTTAGRSSLPMDMVDSLFPANRIQRILILGAGNGAIQILDALCGNSRQRAVGILDDDPSLQGKVFLGTPVVGSIDLEEASRLHREGFFDAAIISISTNVAFRRRLYETWSQQGMPFANVIHSTAHVGINVSMGQGNVILAHCHFGACAQTGNNNFLSAYVSIEHHSILHSHCSFGPGVVTSSSVEIMDEVRCGTGIFIEPYVTIGEQSVIASGCVLTREIPARRIVRQRESLVVSELSKVPPSQGSH